MRKDKNYWQTYIKHAQTLKKRYQIANMQGQHDKAIAKIDRDLSTARQQLRQCQ